MELPSLEEIEKLRKEQKSSKPAENGSARTLPSIEELEKERRARNAPAILEGLQARVDSLNGLLNGHSSRFSQRYSDPENYYRTYRTDTGDWKNSTNDFANQWKVASSELRQYLYDNMDVIGSATAKDIIIKLSGGDYQARQMRDAAVGEHRHYSKYKTPEDYQVYLDMYDFQEARDTHEKRQQIYNNNQKRIEELQAKGYAITDDEKAELAALETENRNYERGNTNQYGQSYGVKAVDDYAYIMDAADFEEKSSNRYFEGDARYADYAKYYTYKEGGEKFNRATNKTEEYIKAGSEGELGYTPEDLEVIDPLGFYFDYINYQGGDGIVWVPYTSVGNEHQGIVGAGRGKWDHLTEGEISIYYYLLNSQGHDAAVKYLTDMVVELDRRNTEQNTGILKEKYDESDLLGKVMLNIGTFPDKFFGTIGGFAVDTAATLRGDEINPYSPLHAGLHYSSTIRGATAEDLDETGWAVPVLDSLGIDVTLGDIYQVGMSRIDSAIATAIFRGGGVVFLGMGAATEEAYRLYKQGASAEQITLGAFAAGAAEAVFEYLPFEKLVNIKDVGTLWKVVTKQLIQSGVEATEETLTEISNIITNAVIMGQQSDLAKLYEECGQDWNKVGIKLAQQVAEAGFGGFIGGSGAGGIQSVISYANTQAQYTNTGRTIVAADGVDALKNLANEVAGVSTGKMGKSLTKQANKVTGEIAAGKNLPGKFVAWVKNMNNARNVGKLYHDVRGYYGTKNHADIVNALTTKDGFSKKKANQIAGALVARLNGLELTDDQVDILESVKDNPTVLSIFESATSEQSPIGQRYQQLRELDTEIAIGRIKQEIIKGVAEKEFTPEGVYKVSDKGKATRTDTNEEIEIKGVNKISKDKMILELSDGQTIDAKNVSFSNEAEALVYEAIANMGDKVDPKRANALIAQYKGGDALVFARGIAQAYTYGLYGADKSELFGKKSLADQLTKEQRDFAYDLGKEYRPIQEQHEKEEARKKMAESGKKPGEKGVYYRDKDGNATDISTYLKTSGIKLNELQKTSIEVMRKMSETMGIRFNVFESWVEDGKSYYLDENGVKTEGNPNGFYDTETGEIYIDLRAGNDYQGTMLFTVAHEVTHFMRQWSPEHFYKIAEIVFQHGKMKGSVSELVALKIETAEAKGRHLSYDVALEEVVADGMETILKDGKVVEFMADVKKQNHAAWQKLKGWFKNLAKFLRKLIVAYKGQYAQTEEGKRVAEFSQDLLNQIEQIYAEGAVAAGESYQGAVAGTDYQTAQKNTTDDGGVKEQARMTEAEIRAVQAVGKISVNQFSAANIKATERFARQYWKEMGVKSPFFRAWFGDWRVNDQTRIQIANKKGDTRGIQRNTDTGWRIQVSGQVFAESRHFAKKNRSALPYLPYINDIVEKAILLDSYGIETGKAKSQNSLLMHSLYAVADIGHGPELLKLYIEEMNDPNSVDTAKRAYQLQNIEKASAVNGGVQGNSPSSLANTTNAIRTVADLFAAVKQKDATFNPNSASAVVNADGTPKVVYHGSADVFNSFSYGHIGSASGVSILGDGFYFSDKKGLAKNYGKNMYACYLRMINPYQATEEDAYKLNTKKLQSQGYDGVILEAPSGTVYMVFENTQIKSATDNIGTFDGSNPDIRYSNRDSDGHQLSAEQQEFFRNSQVRNANGDLLVVRHGTNAEFDTFVFEKAGQNGKAEGYGFYFSDDPEITSRYGSIQKEVYLNITKPLYGTKRTIKKAELAKFVDALIAFDLDKYRSDGLTWQDSFISNYVDTYAAGKTRRYAVNEFVNQIWDYNTNDQDLIFEIANADGRMYESSTMKELYTVLTESIGYDGIIASWSHKDGHSNVYVTFTSEQAKYITNTIPTSNPDLRYSEREYSYEALTSKPDMVVTTVDGNVPKNRADVVAKAKQNAASVGRFDPKTGSVSVHVDDIDADVILGTAGLRHSLDRRINVNAPVTMQAGAILKNSIKINELTPQHPDAQNSYVLIGAAKNSSGQLYIVRSVVNSFSQELTSIEVLYAFNAKTEPYLSIKKETGWETIPNGSQLETATITGSTISIAELLDLVNEYFPDILPEDVLKHYGYDARPEGDLGKYALYQERADESVSNRSLLANAFEGLAQNDIERNKIREYRSKIALINAEEQKLHELNTQIKELSFAKGQRDTKKIRDLQDEATKTANRISIYDKQLLRLEASAPLQAVLDREKKKAYKKAEQRGKEALAAYKERTAKTQRELLSRWQESRKKGIENREKTAMRHKIQSVVAELNQLLLSNDKKRHVPDNLKKAVADALSLVNMDTVGAEERAAKYAALIEAETDPDKIAAYTVTMENILRQGEKMGQRLKDLRDAYEEIQNSDDPDIANAYDPVIAESLKELASSIGNTSLRDMTIEQLSDVYDMYKMVLTRVRDANKSFLNEKKEAISSLASRVVSEVRVAGGQHKFRATILDPVKSFFWNNAKPVYAMEHIGSATMIDAFKNVRKGEDTWAKDVTEARAYYLDKSKEYGYDSWDFDKKYTFKSTSDLEFELTLEQMMALYAYSKRDQAHDHLRLGGFVFDSNIETYKETVEEKDGKVKRKKSIIKYKVNTADAHQITPEILANIIGNLSNEQKSFVDEMQDYLSTVMGAKGNEVTMQMYGVKLFKEKFYFPLKSARQFMFEQNEVAGEVRIKNSGFTNKTKPKANNPIILSNFMDVWANHVNDMSMYHSFVLPLEDFNRIFNYDSQKKEGQPPVSVKGTIQSAYSPTAVSYVKQLITDLNGGAMSDPRETFAKSMTAMFKKAKVFTSSSVIIQQPASIGRAFALVDPKYFQPTMDGMNHNELWAELKQYAPIAIIKEMGYFDTNMGRSTQDFIKAKEYSTFQEKAKAIFTDSGYRDEILSKAPALADELSWCAIWNAVKRETEAKHKDLKPGSEEFLKTAAERFTEVVTKTQVYDSVLARSANMRSKGGLMSMATAFMAEPTTSVNMLEDAIRKSKRGYKGYAARAFASVAVSIVLNNALVALVYGGRDDDEDETYLEKYMQAFISGMLDDVNPITYYPFLKDMWSVLQGYDIERYDMSLISDLADAMKGMVKAYTTEDGDVAGAWLTMAGSVANIGGIPMQNIVREVNGAINFFSTLIEDLSGRATTLGSFGDAIEDTVKDSLPVVSWFSSETKTDKLYDAIISGDTDYVSRLKGSYKDEDSYHNAVRKALRENDPRIKEAAMAQINGNPSERVRIARIIVADGFAQDDVVAAINAEINATESGNSTSTKKEKGFYTVEDFALEIANGDQAAARAAKSDFINTAKKNGKIQEEAEKSFVSSAKAELREMFVAGKISESKVTAALETYCQTEDDPLDANAIYWLLDEWQYEKSTGSSDGYAKYGNFHTAVQTGKNLKAVIKEYTDHGVEAKALASEITEHFKPLYRAMSNYERASIKGYLLNAYAVLGYDRQKKSKDIDKWLED